LIHGELHFPDTRLDFGAAKSVALRFPAGTVNVMGGHAAGQRLPTTDGAMGNFSGRTSVLSELGLDIKPNAPSRRFKTSKTLRSAN
jgi:hypothetical protein